MKRLHLFEFEDCSWFPTSIRNLMTDYLRHVVNVFGMHAPVVPVVSSLLKRSESDTIVDLASGGGGPWPGLVPQLKAEHPGLKVILTDLYPNLEALNWVQQSAPEVFEVRTLPTDALDVPGNLQGLRTQFLSLHHFRPEQVQRIFANAVDAGQPIAVFEFQERTWSHLLQFAMSPVFVLLLSIGIRPFTFPRLLFTYLLPVVPLSVMWDGMVSVLRTYTVQEIEELVANVPGSDTYRWDIQVKKQGAVSVFRAVGQPIGDKQV